MKATSTGEAPPFDTAAFTLVDTAYTNTSGTISLLDSVVNIPLQNVSLTQTPRALADTLFASVTRIAEMRVGGAVGLFPNPLKDVLHFDAKAAVTVEMLSADGRLVLARNGVRSLNVSMLSPGVYFVRVMDENGRLLSVGRMVKE